MKCDDCELRKFYASAFDMHWMGVEDCPFECEKVEPKEET